LLAPFLPCPGFDLVLFGSHVLFPPPVLVLLGACSFPLATVCVCRCCLNPFFRAFCSDCILDMLADSDLCLYMSLLLIECAAPSNISQYLRSKYSF
jgi:hypothetical protein